MSLLNTITNSIVQNMHTKLAVSEQKNIYVVCFSGRHDTQRSVYIQFVDKFNQHTRFFQFFSLHNAIQACYIYAIGILSNLLARLKTVLEYEMFNNTHIIKLFSSPTTGRTFQQSYHLPASSCPTL